MSEGLTSQFGFFARAFFWCLAMFLQLCVATAMAIFMVLSYFWAFPRPKTWGVSSQNLLKDIADFGYGWFGLVVVIAFVVSLIISRSYWSEVEESRSNIEHDHSIKLEAEYGASAATEPEGNGYLTTVTVNGKQYNAGHQLHSIRGRNITVNTNAAWVAFPIEDKTFELSIVQPRYFMTPKTERLSLGLTTDSDPLSVLMQRYECSFSDRKAIAAFIEDAEVSRELLPKYPNSYERLTFVIKNGVARLDCSTDTKSDRVSAESASFVLAQKLIKRAEIFDRRLREIGKA